MTTKLDLETALKDAIRSHNEPAKRTIRMVLTSIKFMEIEKGQPLDEAAIASVLQKEMKNRRKNKYRCRHKSPCCTFLARADVSEKRA